ncbi:molybdopterin molybdotransferase [Kineosphaera limosa]|uniref:Molybdopterin molybdenumtransferase n=1 Tax=Kineosphaera limosa NBRC 100340 TaxID=1184609 RepID=K6X1I1_9MICO|nr:gephyrin-like molybdotransferase Glp [Kineosphaera limosa]NYE02025.1 molybdopterin molybdotransferase [Kineosphaera limosa]GAB98222.1 molybdenum cofactor biosynthesis protein MoeA [Kineosphaera limosa NBRC 100340]
MISVAEHRRRILETVRRLAPQQVPVTQAQGCVLAKDVEALVPLPGFDNSAMDGYIVGAADVAGLPAPDSADSAEASDAPEGAGQPVRLPVDGDIPAGDTRQLRLEPGHAYRIMTGAPIPAGGDVVIPVELTDGGTEYVTLHAADAPGRHIRRAGEDVHAGDIVLRAGTVLGARQLAIAAAVGAGELSVYPRPRVVCLSTGDELLPPGSVPGFGQVVDSNGLMLAAALREAGFDARAGGVVLDTEEAVTAALDAALADADAIVTTGGVSMGAYDAVKAALSSLGTVAFDKVAMQPGKPQGFGTLGEREVPVFTLPGNPVSALVSTEVFVLPALRTMAGLPVEPAPPPRARVLDGWPSPPGRAQFVRVIVEEAQAEPWMGAASGTAGPPGPSLRSAGGQGSHVLQALADADALAYVPADVTRVEPGDLLGYRRLGQQGWAAE